MSHFSSHSFPANFPTNFPRKFSLLFQRSVQRSTSLILAGCTGLLAGLLITDLSGPDVQAQQIRKFAHDYFFESITYNPQDPQHRSDIYRKQIGHSGRFYNCDNEECKRHSPYIDWKTNFQPQWVNTRGLVDGTVRDLNRVKQRIQNGSCNEPELPGIHTTNYKFRRASEFLMMDQPGSQGVPTLATRAKAETPVEASENREVAAETSTESSDDSKVAAEDAAGEQSSRIAAELPRQEDRGKLR
jgi:hypothetical protein